MYQNIHNFFLLTNDFFHVQASQSVEKSLFARMLANASGTLFRVGQIASSRNARGNCLHIRAYNHTGQKSDNVMLIFAWLQQRRYYKWTREANQLCTNTNFSQFVVIHSKNQDSTSQ